MENPLIMRDPARGRLKAILTASNTLNHRCMCVTAFRKDNFRLTLPLLEGVNPKRMKKKMFLASAIVLTVLVGGALWFWWSMGQPFYRPGMVRRGANLTAPLAPAPQARDGTFWTVEPGIRLHHFSRGTGRPVLFVHGGPGFPLMEPPAAFDALTNQFEFHYYDQRGCGQSTRPFDRFASRNYFANLTRLEGALGIGAQVADLERIRRILGQDRLILIGHSFGGFLAAMYAAEFPEHAEALVLVAPAGVLKLPEPDGYFDRIRPRLVAAKQAEMDTFLREYLNFGRLFDKSESDWAALNRQAGGYFLQAAGITYLQKQGRPPDNGGWMVQAMYVSMGKRHDYREALRAVKAPVLVLHGGDDILPESNSREYAALMPNARFQLLQVAPGKPGSQAGHFLFDDQPEAFTRAVEIFLAGLGLTNEGDAKQK